MKKPINIGDKLLFHETGFKYVVIHVTQNAVLIVNFGKDLWIPKSLIDIKESLLSTHGYRLHKLNPFPAWWIDKNNIH